MKTNDRIQRRSFLQSTGTLSLAMFLGQVTQLRAGNSKVDRGALDKLMAEMEAKGPKFLSVPRKDGEFLNLLVKATGAKKVLEIGTSHGYSAIWISLGLEETGGHMTTVEIQSDRVALAREHLARAGLSHRVTFKEGDAHKVVPTIDGPFDLVFLDADKEGQADYFNKLFPNKLPRGAVLVSHNAIRHRENMKEYLDLVKNHGEFDTVILSLTMEDGFAVSYRHRG